MGSPQTVILPFGQPVAVPGEATRIIDSTSAINAEAATNMQFGIGVKPGAKSKEALLYTTGAALLGVTIQDRVHGPGSFGDLDQTGSPPGLKPGSSVPVLTEGRAWVVVDGDAVITPNVTRGYVRKTANGAGKSVIGAFRHDVDGGDADDHTNQVLFVSGVLNAADQLTGGTTKIAEIQISRSNTAT